MPLPHGSKGSQEQAAPSGGTALPAPLVAGPSRRSPLDAAPAEEDRQTRRIPNPPVFATGTPGQRKTHIGTRSKASPPHHQAASEAKEEAATGFGATVARQAQSTRAPAQNWRPQPCASNRHTRPAPLTAGREEQTPLQGDPCASNRHTKPAQTRKRRQSRNKHACSSEP